MIAPENGSVSFLELNSRLGAIGALGFTVGFDHSLLALELAAGRWTGDAVLEDDYATGLQASSIHADLTALHAAYGRSEIGLREAAGWFGTALATFIRADVDTTWSWRDPLPGLYGFLLPLRRRRAGSG